MLNNYKIPLLLSLFIILTLPLDANLSEPDEEEEDSDNTTSIYGVEIYNDRYYVQDTTKPWKALMLDAGYGIDGVSLAFNIRYWNIAVGIGYTGVLAPRRPYSYTPPVGERFSPSQPLPKGYYADRAPGTAVFIDGSYYLPYLTPFNFFATVGFFAQNDTLLAVSNESGNAFYRGYGQNSGVTFGGGIEYRNSEWIRTAVGYHSKRGVFFRLAYTWR